MLFNSTTFLVFFLAVYGMYLLLRHRYQNWMLLIASYLFYGWWDWRFLTLIWLSTIIDYACGLKIEQSKERTHKRRFLILSIVSNLTILGFFKYFNFFADSFYALTETFGWDPGRVTLNLVLPVGISFYTFQSMSYTIDIYRERIKPTRRLDDFALFVAFFPQLVAGPIERASHLLPQMTQHRHVTFDKFREGCFLILFGLFQKIYVADQLGPIVDKVFAASEHDGFTVLLALYAFAIQIFCDFAGYSNIARGLGATMGFDIVLNFNAPYFAASPSEFWRRWHMSLSSWLRDYLYIPLGGNRSGKWKTQRNIMITMLLGGLWHGAAWHYVFWGFYHAVILIISRLMNRVVKVNVPTAIKIFISFHLITVGWLFFRAETISQAFTMLNAVIFRFSSDATGMSYFGDSAIIFGVTMVVLIQFLQWYKKDVLVLYRLPLPLAAPVHATLLYLMVINPVLENPFIYFQF